MRVLFVVGEFPTVSETFILDQITGLIERGNEVTILGRRPVRPAPEHESVARFRLLERARYHRAGLLWGLLGPLPRACALRGQLPFDVVLAHFGPNGLRALGLRELGVFRAPIATVFHGHDLSRWLRQRGERAYRRLFARGELMLAISDGWRNKLLELGCPAHKVLVHRVGISLSPQAATVPASPPRVLSVGRLVEKKGFAHALRAIAVLRADIPGLRYDLVGDGPLRPQLERLAHELGLVDAVTFHGPLARDQVTALRRAASAVLVPSVTASDGDREGIPVVIMEAMADGIAVVATRHSSIPELVVDGETGMLAREGDQVELAHALSSVLGDEALRRRLVRAARGRVAEQHDIERLNDVLAERLAELAATHTPA